MEAIVHDVAFVVADVKEAAFVAIEVVVRPAAEAAANAAACCADDIAAAAAAATPAAEVAADVDGPESVASTGLSQELLRLQGCE